MYQIFQNDKFAFNFTHLVSCWMFVIIQICFALNLSGQNLADISGLNREKNLGSIIYHPFLRKTVHILPPVDTTKHTLLTPLATEICNNNIDDDGNGFIDCADPICNCQAKVFPCNNDMYLLQLNPSNTAQTLVERLSFVSNVPTLTTLFTFDYTLNALAYHNGFLYAMDNNGTHLFRIDAVGTIVDLGAVANLPTPNVQWSGGTIDKNGNMYIIEGTVSPNYRIYKIPLLPGGTYTATQVGSAASTIPNNAGDIAIDGTGILYAWVQADATTTSNSGLYTINLSTAVATKVGTQSFLGTSFGSLLPAANGSLYAYGIIGDPAFNQQNFYLIDKITGIPTQIGTSGTSVSRSDGCSCPYRITMKRSTTSSCIQSGGSVCWDYAIKSQYNTSVASVIMRDTLDKRFSYNFNVASTQTTLRTLFGSTLTITLSSFNGGTNNVLTISNMSIPNGTSTFQLCSTEVSSSIFSSNEIVYFQAYLTNLPTFLGSIEPSDNPATLNPIPDATPLTISPALSSASAINTGPYCPGATAQLNSDGGNSYSWSGPNSFSSSIQNPTFTVSNSTYAGTYTVTVTNSSGCTAAATTNLVMNTLPTSVAGANQTQCGNNFTMAATTPTVGTGVWSVVGGAATITTPSSTTSALTVTTSPATLRWTVTSTCGTASSNVVLTAFSQISITSQPASSINECLTGTNSLTVSATGGIGILTYQWQSSTSSGGNYSNISGATSSSYTPPSTSVGALYYRVIISSSGTNCTPATSNISTVTINAAPTISITAPSSAICTNGAIQFTALTSGGVGCSLQWQLSTDNGTTWSNISGATLSTYTTPSIVSNTRYRAQFNCTGSGCCN